MQSLYKGPAAAEPSSESNGLSLRELFDHQIQTLRDRSCPELIVRSFEEQRATVLRSAGRAGTLSDNQNVPFVPVMPQRYRSIYDQMQMLLFEGTSGCNHLDPSRIRDLRSTPKIPYYIFDIEIGEAYLGSSPQDASRRIKKTGRHALTTVEVIAMVLHTDRLAIRSLDAAASRHDKDTVPLVRIYNGMPRLHCRSLTSTVAHWGSPSCAVEI